jgi:hypothetical protein
MGRNFTGTASTLVTYAFELRVESWVTVLPPGQGANIANILINAGAASWHALTLIIAPGQTLLQESFHTADAGTQYRSHPFSQTIPLASSAADASDGWMQVELTLNLAQRTCNAKLNRMTVVNSESLDPSWTSGTPSVTLGLGYVPSEASPWIARYDNVTVDWQ